MPVAGQSAGWLPGRAAFAVSTFPCAGLASPSGGVATGTLVHAWPVVGTYCMLEKRVNIFIPECGPNRPAFSISPVTSLGVTGWEAVSLWILRLSHHAVYVWYLVNGQGLSRQTLCPKPGSPVCQLFDLG